MSAHSTVEQENPGGLRVVPRSAWSLVLGGLATGGFYAALTVPPLAGTIVDRYATGHIVEYISFSLFFWALADLLLIGFSTKKQRRAVPRGLDFSNLSATPSALELSDHLKTLLASAKHHWSESYVGRRLHAAWDFLRRRDSAEGLMDHLRYHAELDAEASSGHFGLAKIIAWMIPILGFLGTVIGITLAIANISPEQLESSLGDVTGGLAVAFDTTALALTLSMALMMVLFLIERAENALLQDAERFLLDELGHRVVIDPNDHRPELKVIQRASEAVISHSQQLLHQQVELWKATVGEMRQSQAHAHGQQVELLAEGLRQLQAERSLQSQAVEKTAVQLQQTCEAVVAWTEQLKALTTGQDELTRTQEQLNHNLAMVRQSQGFEDAVHSLTAAVHLLTVRRPELKDAS